jgi:hypothetical protein
MRYLFLAALAASQIFAAGVKKTTLHVSVIVRPAARLEVQSSTAVILRSVPNVDTQVWVWTAVDICDTPLAQRVIPDPGVHQVLFTAAEVAGKNLVCAESTDGAIHASANLPAVP